MNITQRQAEISELLRQEAFLTIEMLAERFGVTTQTVRRDVNVLCDLGFHIDVLSVSMSSNVIFYIYEHVIKYVFG